MIGHDEREFTFGIGAGAQEKHALAVGTDVTGTCEAVADPRIETVEFYKVRGLRVLARGASAESPPPWHGVPPALETYRARGHRRLDARTYAARCASCMWGALMPVEMIIDQWNPAERAQLSARHASGI